MSNAAAFADLKSKDHNFFWHPATQMADYIKNDPSIMSRGSGYKLWDFNDKEYIDGNAGVWCVHLGYGNQHLIDAATKQLSTLAYSSLFAFVHEPSIELCARLVNLMPDRSGKAFLVTDGSEAVDTAIKMARQYFWQNAQGQRQIILSLRGSYHGLSFGALSATGMPGYRKPFGHLLPGFYQVDVPLQSLASADSNAEIDNSWLTAFEKEATYHGLENIAAIIIEPILASGGVVVPDKGFLQGISAFARKIGALFICDEVTTGFGRSGPMFAFERAGIRPDIITMSKGLTSGYMPLGAVVATDELYEGFLGTRESGRAFANAYTYGGHPVSCAVALATLDVFENENILNNVADVGPYLKAQLLALKERTGLIANVRGIGMLFGIEFVDRTGAPVNAATGRAISSAALSKGLIIRALGSMGHVLILAPPLILDKSGVDQIIERLELAMKEVLVL